jgi:hypothetical protein
MSISFDRRYTNMTKAIPTVATVLLFALMLATGGAFAGGEGCSGKGKKGEEGGGTAAVTLPSQPLA